MKQVRKHERLINMAALSVIVFAFTSSIIMVGWFIKQPHIAADSPSLEARHQREPSLEKSEPHLPAEELPPATGVILSSDFSLSMPLFCQGNPSHGLIIPKPVRGLFHFHGLRASAP